MNPFQITIGLAGLAELASAWLLAESDHTLAGMSAAALALSLLAVAAALNED